MSQEVIVDLNFDRESFSQLVRSYLKDLGIYTTGVEAILDDLERNRFFPRNSLNLLADSGIFDVHFFRLLYLCLHLEQAAKEDEAKYTWLKFSPFTEVQQKSMKRAKRWAKITAFFLNPCVAGVIFLFWILFIFVGFISLSTIPIPAVVSVSLSASAISSLGLAFMGLFITGNNPDFASRTANEAQNHERAIQTAYRYMSQRLLEMYAHHDTQALAEDIAILFNKKNRRRLKEKMLRLVDNSSAGELLRSIKEVHTFIREGSRNTALLNPDLTTHWLTLESNALMNPPRPCNLKILFRPTSPSNSHASSSPSNSYTELDYDERMK